jgi:hypothetical protein
MLSIANVGVHVTLHTSLYTFGIDGSLRGELPDGYLISLDREGRDIRLIRNVYSVDYHRDRELAAFAPEDGKSLDEELRRLNELLQPSMDRALRTVDYRKLRDFSEKAPGVARRINQQMRQRETEEAVHIEPDVDEFLSFLQSQADRAVDLHGEVYREFEDSGFTGVVSEFGQRLSHLPQTAALPLADATPSLAPEMLRPTERKAWTAERHRALLAGAENLRSQLAFSVWASHRGGKTMGPEPETAPSARGQFLEWCGAGLRILAGSGLAVGNGALGITAGLTTTMLTIGATAVPAYVGIATSIYTGLTQVAEGLEKISKIGKAASA